MGKEFDLGTGTGTGRTALGDNHWMGSGGAKAKMYLYAVCLLSCRH